MSRPSAAATEWREHAPQRSPERAGRFRRGVGVPFARYDKETHDVTRGTILFLDPAPGEVTRAIPGFPHEPRTYQLARGH